MAKVFNTHVAVHKNHVETVWFKKGDEVPGWAEELVGSHTYAEHREEEDVRLTDPHYELDTSEVGFTTPTVLPTTGAEVADVDEEDDLDSMSKAELQEVAEELDLPTSGNKEELKARIREAREEEDAE
jgi:hypothetical protein